MNTITSLKDLRAGDLMISGQSSAPTKLLVYLGQLLLGRQFRIGKFAAGHFGVIVPPLLPGGPLRVVEAMPSGARVRTLRETDWSPTTAFVRLPEEYEGQHRDAAELALLMVGIPYSFMSYVYLFLYLIGIRNQGMKNFIDRRQNPKLIHLPVAGLKVIRFPVEAICSVHAEQSWTLTGYKVVVGTSPQVVTPGMLAEQLWDRPGVIKGRYSLAA